jgi:hypothetical protein
MSDVLGAAAESQKAPLSFFMSVCLSARISVAPNGRFCIKFDVVRFFRIFRIMEANKMHYFSTLF